MGRYDIFSPKERRNKLFFILYLILCERMRMKGAILEMSEVETKVEEVKTTTAKKKTHLVFRDNQPFRY